MRECVRVSRSSPLMHRKANFKQETWAQFGSGAPWEPRRPFSSSSSSSSFSPRLSHTLPRGGAVSPSQSTSPVCRSVCLSVCLSVEEECVPGPGRWWPSVIGFSFVFLSDFISVFVLRREFVPGALFGNVSTDWFVVLCFCFSWFGSFIG